MAACDDKSRDGNGLLRDPSYVRDEPQTEVTLVAVEASGGN